VALLLCGRTFLSAQLANLQGLGFTQQQVVAALFKSYTVLQLPPGHLAGLEAALKQELQLPKQAARELFIKVLRHVPQALSCSLETAHERLAWLAKVRLERVGTAQQPKLIATPTSSAGFVDAFSMMI
jgi:hypothetical protein